MERLAFTYQCAPARVVFGRGSLNRLDEELLALNVRRALVLCTPCLLYTSPSPRD